MEELYRRVEICERLLHVVSVTDTRIRPGMVIQFEFILFPYQNEALVTYNGIDYTLNYGNIFNFNYNSEKWINISKKDLLFLDKTIIQPSGNLLYILERILFKPIIKGYSIDSVANNIFGWSISDDIKIDLWNEMISQLIPANPDAVETITRETINEALFETRLKIHEIKNAPPRMNQLMYTVSPPITPRSLTPRPLTPRPLTPRPLTPRPLTPRKLKLVPRESQLLSVPNQPLRRRTKRNKKTLFGPNKNALFGPTGTL